MIMDPIQIDFIKISRALALSLETMKQSEKVPHFALLQLESAQKQLQEALYYNMSRAIG